MKVWYSLLQITRYNDGFMLNCVFLTLYWEHHGNHGCYIYRQFFFFVKSPTISMPSVLLSEWKWQPANMVRHCYLMNYFQLARLHSTWAHLAATTNIANTGGMAQEVDILLFDGLVNIKSSEDSFSLSNNEGT